MSSNEGSQDITPAVASPRSAGWRRWLPLAILGGEALGLGATQFLENAEIIPPAEAFLTKFSLVGLGTILIFLWFVFLAPASRSLRQRVGIVVLVAVVLLLATVRIQGVSGDVHFRLKWAWTPAIDETLPSATAQADRTEAVNLLATTAHDWPQFLGPHRTAAIPTAEFASDWTAAPPKLLWRQPIGAGWSSFAVVGHYGVTQEQRGSEELITCYDLRDGKLQWAHALPVRFHEVIAGIGPRATPTIHSGRVYALGALGHLTCLDGATGKPLWQHDIVADNGAGQPQWGRSGSPLIYDQLVVVSAGGPNGKSLVAYDQADGHKVWSGGDDASAYASPTLMTLAGVEQIVMINEHVTCGHDPTTGQVLWERAWPERGVASPNVSQPLAVGNDRLLLSKGYGIGAELWQFQRNGDQWNIETVWKNNHLKTKMTNAVLHADHVYGLDEGTLTCIDVATGKRLWKRGRFGHGQVLLLGNLLLVQSEDGQVALVDPSPAKYQELARFEAVAGQSWNYPAVSGRTLILRTEQEAACYELPAASL